MKEIFISHPGLQHAHQLAWALHERGVLQAFWSGVPVIGDGEPLPAWLPAPYARRLKKVGIPQGLRRHPILFQGLLRSGKILRTGASRNDFAHRVFHLFDWWVSRRIHKLRPTVVICYENSAYHTFRAAKAIGAKCILDAPSLHHAAGARLMKVGATPYLAEINRRKDEEIAMADLILTCSPMAGESYIDAGIPAAKVQPVLLGATLPDGILGWEAHAQPVRFIFAGGLRHLKSIDLILAVFERLHAEGLAYHLTFVGGESEAGWVKQIGQTPSAHYIPSVPQAELFQLLARSDCLLLPSRFDSFGMVVAEAMACGTPAIVSNHTGAKAIIEQFPGSGWITGCDEESLYCTIKARIEDRVELFSSRQNATEASKHFTWEAYRVRVGTLILDWLN